MRLSGGQLDAQQLLTQQGVKQLVLLADNVRLVDVGDLAVIAWDCLLRVQSEAVHIEKGCADDATAFPGQRHSGLWMDAIGCLCLRLQRRKNQPMGSLLRRNCSCRLEPVLCSPLCVS